MNIFDINETRRHLKVCLPLHGTLRANAPYKTVEHVCVVVKALTALAPITMAVSLIYYLYTISPAQPGCICSGIRMSNNQARVLRLCEVSSCKLSEKRSHKTDEFPGYLFNFCFSKKKVQLIVGMVLKNKTKQNKI